MHLQWAPPRTRSPGPFGPGTRKSPKRVQKESYRSSKSGLWQGGQEYLPPPPESKIKLCVPSLRYRVVADVWKKDVWEFQAKSGSSGSCRLFLHFLRKIAVQEMSGKTPGAPRHPSSRHPRPSDGRCPNPGQHRNIISTIAFAGSARISALRWRQIVLSYQLGGGRIAEKARL